LPCGAGKTLVGITTACTIKKKTLVLCNSNVSVEQWYNQFEMWSTIDKKHLIKFTADSKEKIPDSPCILFTTYNMLTFNGQRSEKSQKIMDQLENIEWGLMVRSF
jgi:DNA excision repair protein ERCC-3